MQSCGTSIIREKFIISLVVLTEAVLDYVAFISLNKRGLDIKIIGNGWKV